MRHLPHEDTRRDFIRGSSLLLAGAVPAAMAGAVAAKSVEHPANSKFRIGLVGCGFRGTNAAAHALNTTAADVRLVAVADLFEDRLQQACRSLKSKCPDKFEVGKETRFVGFDAYRRLLETDLDLVILATAPSFRPLHVEAAIEFGKHVFAEKPVAIDPPGVRRFMAACDEARQRQLAVAVGLQRRHIGIYQQTIDQLQQGAIGQILYARAYCMRPASRLQPRRKGQSELEFQLRNWQRFNWAGGDCIVEQHVQNLDVINWLVGDHPAEAQGVGGRQFPQAAVGSEGNIYDHHSVEYLYRNGVRLLSMTQQTTGDRSEVSEWAHGTQGWCDISQGEIYDGENQLIWKAEGSREGYQAEFDKLFADLRSGKAACEGQYAAESTLTAIMGRMATYTGKRVRWGDCLASTGQLADVAAFKSLNDAPPIPTA